MNPPNTPNSPDNSVGNLSSVSIPPQETITSQPTETLTQAPPPNLDQAFVTPPTPKSNKRMFKFLASFILLFIILGGTLGFGVLVAYGKVDLKNNDLENKIASFIFKLPFINPTPEFILGASSRAHQSVTSLAFDSSFAVEMVGGDTLINNPLSLMGTSGDNPFDLSTFEIAMNGYLDYSDEENPQTKVNMNVEGQIDLDMLAFKEMMYFKVNKIPTTVSTLLIANGFDTDPYLNSWISYPINELETESGDLLNQQKDTEVNTTDYDRFIEVMQSDVLPKVTLSSSDEVEDTYRLTVNLTNQEIKSLVHKLSDERGIEAYLDSKDTGAVFDNFELSAWINKNDFLVRKIQLYTVVAEGAVIDPASNVLGTSFDLTKNTDAKVRIAMTMNLSQYGEHFAIQAPETSETIEEFVARISNSMTQEYSGDDSILPSSPVTQLDRARDAGRKQTVTQLGRATEAFHLSHLNIYPSGTNFWIQELVSAGELSGVPDGVDYTNVEPCTKSVVKNSWCYETDNSSFITYTRLEETSECQTAGSLESQNAWFVYSSTDGRAGTVCQDVEPSVGSQTFAPTTLY